MSAATTEQEALREFLTDLKRINPPRVDFVQSVQRATNNLAQLANEAVKVEQEALTSFIAEKKAEFEQHLEVKQANAEAMRALVLPAVTGKTGA